MAAVPAPPPAPGPEGPKLPLALGGATLLVIASMVGTGVFTTGGLLVATLGPRAALVAWGVGGLVALAGALSYAELGAALPRSGGEYHLLGRIYGPALGFVAGVASIVVGFAAPMAASALAFGRYFAALVPGVAPGVAGAALVVVLALLHGLRGELGLRLQSVVTLAELLLMALLIAVAARSGFVHSVAVEPPLRDVVLSPPFAAGLIFVGFAYSGWNAAVYVAGEVRDPGRTLPRALTLGTLVVTALYVGLNAAFIAAVPRAELAGVVEVGHVAARRLLGPSLGALLSGAILIALVSSASAMLLQGSRVCRTVGQDHPRLALLARLGPRGTPTFALALQAALALALVATAGFDALLSYIGLTLTLSTMATVVGVLRLRRTAPELPRPYRVPLHPVPELLFLCVSLWVVVRLVLDRPTIALATLGTVAAGFALHWLVRRP